MRLPDRTAHGAGFDWLLFGFHENDTLIVKESSEIHIGSLSLVRMDGEEFFSRVCSVNGPTVRITGNDEYYDIPSADIIGPVVEIKHDNCVQAEIAALRLRLEALGKEDDQIIRCTEGYKIEKEIYDLEHPKIEESEDDSDDEWPDVIGADGE